MVSVLLELGEHTLRNDTHNWSWDPNPNWKSTLSPSKKPTIDKTQLAVAIALTLVEEGVPADIARINSVVYAEDILNNV
jgi:hypothetical protein